MVLGCRIPCLCRAQTGALPLVQVSACYRSLKSKTLSSPFKLLVMCSLEDIAKD